MSRNATWEGLAERLSAYPEVYLVYDGHLGGWASRLLSAAPAIRAAFAIDATEEGKDISTVLDICRRLLEAGASRSALIVSLGGGITTDIAGFAASIYKRGIRFAHVPTTLLAQVDAALGGKTGVNFLGYKNMLGTIRQPEFTWSCSEVLETLSPRDFRSGLAEMLKTFIIENHGGAYARALRMQTSLLTGTPMERVQEELRSLIAAAAAVKQGIVARDEFEGGERRKLNLGHTFAHAIEHEARRTGTDVTHGEAVAMGLVLAARLSERRGLAPAGFEARLTADLSACGLPTAPPFPLPVLIGAMTRDKKAEGGIVHFVLIRDIGDVVLQDIAPHALEAILI